jgi:hypothetical protein
MSFSNKTIIIIMSQTFQTVNHVGGPGARQAGRARLSYTFDLIEKRAHRTRAQCHFTCVRAHTCK